MAMAVSSWRDEMYFGCAGEFVASASHSGAQSEPGDAKIASTPMARRPPRTASAPVTRRISLNDAECRHQLRIALVLGADVGGEGLRRHRLGDVHGERPEALQHLWLLHQPDHLAVQPVDGLA